MLHTKRNTALNASNPSIENVWLENSGGLSPAYSVQFWKCNNVKRKIILLVF